MMLLFPRQLGYTPAELSELKESCLQHLKHAKQLAGEAVRDKLRCRENLDIALKRGLGFLPYSSPEYFWQQFL